MDDWEEKKKLFLEEINKNLNPVLRVVECRLNIFDIELCETPYALQDQVCTTDKMNELIDNLCRKHLNRSPSYNNTHRCFWIL